MKCFKLGLVIKYINTFTAVTALMAVQYTLFLIFGWTAPLRSGCLLSAEGNSWCLREEPLLISLPWPQTSLKIQRNMSIRHKELSLLTELLRGGDWVCDGGFIVLLVLQEVDKWTSATGWGYHCSSMRTINTRLRQASCPANELATGRLTRRGKHSTNEHGLSCFHSSQSRKTYRCCCTEW